MSDLLYYLLFAVSSLVVIELISITVVKIVNKKFQWLICRHTKQI